MGKYRYSCANSEMKKGLFHVANNLSLDSCGRPCLLRFNLTMIFASTSASTDIMKGQSWRFVFYESNISYLLGLVTLEKFTKSSNFDILPSKTPLFRWISSCTEVF